MYVNFEFQIVICNVLIFKIWYVRKCINWWVKLYQIRLWFMKRKIKKNIDKMKWKLVIIAFWKVISSKFQPWILSILPIKRSKYHCIQGLCNQFHIMQVNVIDKMFVEIMFFKLLWMFENINCHGSKNLSWIKYMMISNSFVI